MGFVGGLLVHGIGGWLMARVEGIAVTSGRWVGVSHHVCDISATQ